MWYPDKATSYSGLTHWMHACFVDFRFLCIRTAANGQWADSGPNLELADPGETVTFEFIIINNGTKTLSNFCLTDANIWEGCLGCPLFHVDVLSPGGSFSCNADHKVPCLREFLLQHHRGWSSRMIHVMSDSCDE